MPQLTQLYARLDFRTLVEWKSPNGLRWRIIEGEIPNVEGMHPIVEVAKPGRKYMSLFQTDTTTLKSLATNIRKAIKNMDN